MSFKRSVGLSLAVLARVTSVALAQDPLPLYPEDYKIIGENERVRVLDFRLRKGAKEGSHSRRSPGGVHAAGGLAQRGGAGAAQGQLLPQALL
jgi:hypothetical protein